MPNHLARMDKFMDNSELVTLSLLCHRPHRAWSVPGISHVEKLACFVEVSVMDRLNGKFQNSQKSEHAQTVCTRLFFSAHPQESGNEAKCRPADFI